MSYLTHDTDWDISAKGNHWRRLDETLLVVGKNEYGYYWVRVGEGFLSDAYPTLTEAKKAAERKINGDNNDFIDW